MNEILIDIKLQKNYRQFIINQKIRSKISIQFKNANEAMTMWKLKKIDLQKLKIYQFLSFDLFEKSFKFFIQNVNRIRY